MRGREAPLAHGLHRTIVEPAAETAQNAHVADGAVAPDDDLELDVAADVLPARLLGVARLHFLQQARRIDAAARTVRSAPGPTSRAWTDAAAVALAEAGALAAAGAAARPGAVALVLRGRLRQHADAAAIIRRRRHDWCNHDGKRFRLERLRLRLRRCRHRY